MAVPLKKDMAKVVNESVEGLGIVELSGIKLESADARLLDVGQLDLDKHVAMQPAAIAYFGALKKEAGRKLAALKRSYDRWEKKQLGAAKTVVYSRLASKTTATDVEAQFIVDNEKEIEKWDEMLDRAQFDYDTLEVWYEAWRQKSFSIREHVNIEEDENSIPDSYKRKEGESAEVTSERLAKVREILNRKQQGQ